MKVTARIPAPAKIASKPGVVLVVVVDLVVLVGSVEEVVFVTVVVDLTASGPDVVLMVVDLVTPLLRFQPAAQSWQSILPLIYFSFQTFFSHAIAMNHICCP